LAIGRPRGTFSSHVYGRMTVWHPCHQPALNSFLLESRSPRSRPACAPRSSRRSLSVRRPRRCGFLRTSESRFRATLDQGADRAGVGTRRAEARAVRDLDCCRRPSPKLTSRRTLSRLATSRKRSSMAGNRALAKPGGRIGQRFSCLGQSHLQRSACRRRRHVDEISGDPLLSRDTSRSRGVAIKRRDGTIAIGRDT
jgi:hypothetical protein